MHAVTILMLNQAFHDYGQAFGFNFKPDVDPFTAVGVLNFNQLPGTAAALMALSKIGVLFLSTVYLFIAHEGCLLLLNPCVYPNLQAVTLTLTLTPTQVGHFRSF